jgi:integrase/recombinase XerD
MYLRADPTEKLALLDAHHAPMTKPGRFRGPSDKLMQILAAATQRS